LKQRTLYGAHSNIRLGTDPVTFYIQTAYEKILYGYWDWKDGRSLTEQLIRVIDSVISTEVDKTDTKKSKEFKTEVRDVESDFYYLGSPEESLSDIQEENAQYEARLTALENAVNGDEKLQFIFDAIKVGYKRGEIAELMGITPKQFDKLKERLYNTVRNSSQAEK
jgi:DNA-directed RNA polymerase specialized sigma24 family protein